MNKTSRAKASPVYPYRVALCGGWGDHNFVNFLADGYVVVVQVQPTITFHDRCGICSSTRQILMQKYPKGIPDNIDKYELATELYYWENERKVPIGGSQDAWGSVYPGVSLLHYRDQARLPRGVRLHVQSVRQRHTQYGAHGRARMRLPAFEERFVLRQDLCRRGRSDTATERDAEQQEEQTSHAHLRCFPLNLAGRSR